MQICVSGGASAGLLYQGRDVAVVDPQALIRVDVGPPTVPQKLQDNEGCSQDEKDGDHQGDQQRGCAAGLAHQQAPGLRQAAVVGPRGYRQQVAHERVDVHAL